MTGRSFEEIVLSRRMCRAFRRDPLPGGSIEEIVDLGSRAPSAGKTQGWHVVGLEGEQTATFWDITLPPDRRATFRWQRLLDAPAILLPLADPAAYLDRYAEPDKVHTGLGDDVDRWPAPYWTVDASMAVMTMLLAIEARGLGALFFGVFRDEAALRDALGIPDGLELLGAIALGHPLREDEPGRSAARHRRGAGEILRRGRW